MSDDGSRLSSVVIGLLIAVVTLVSVGVTVEGGTTLMAMRSTLLAIVGGLLVVFVAPCLILLGVWVFHKAAL